MRHITKIFALFTLLFSLALLSACGFHLRGSVTEGVQLPPTYLTGTAGPLLQEVRYYLVVSKVPVVKNQKEAQLVIDLISEDVQRRVLSVGSTGKVEEYEVSYAATYAVRRAELTTPLLVITLVLAALELGVASLGGVRRTPEA